MIVGSDLYGMCYLCIEKGAVPVLSFGACVELRDAVFL